MKPIVIRCNAYEREELIIAFAECGISTERRVLQNKLMSLFGLEVYHDSLSEFVHYAKEFGEKHRKVLQARIVDANGEENLIDVTEKNIYHDLADNKGDLNIFLFRDNEPKNENPE
ncbi:MAG: hypothetical protein Q8O92_15335 [Candidatus Latescibacter sp.]|nr:hypothetical protein [Candidatus Latescibacter sp.]